MKTARTDVKVIKRKITVPNSSWLGFSSSTLRPGDLFTYQDGNQVRTGKMHGVINTLRFPKVKLVLAQVLFNNLQFSGERWIDPKDVIETIPSERVSKHLKAYFLELEGNQL